MAAREREEVGDAARVKRLRGEPAAMQGARIRDALLPSVFASVATDASVHRADGSDRVEQPIGILAGQRVQVIGRSSPLRSRSPRASSA